LSADGNTFQKVTTGKWKANIAAKTTSWAEQKARYVKFEVTGGSSSGVAVSELEIIGKQSGAGAGVAAN